MMIQVVCPGCRTLLQCDSAHLGKQVVCFQCKQRFELRPAPSAKEDVIEDALPVEDPIFDALPAPPPPAKPGRVPLPPPDEKEVASEEEAKARLEEWQMDMPHVQSAYRPSGVLPSEALMLMLLGALLGIPAGVLAEALVAGIVVGTMYLSTLLLVCGCIGAIALVVVAILGLVAPFAAGGWAAARCTTDLGRRGKNRNVRIAVVLSELSAALSVLIVGLLFWAFGKEAFDQRGHFNTKPGDLDIAYIIYAVLGGMVAMFTARYVAGERVRSAKFCEECEQYMDQAKVKMLRHDALKAMVWALGVSKLEAARLLQAPAGDDGEVTGFTCPQCGRGYVEVQAHFKVHWQEKKKQKEKKESWPVASASLTPAEMEPFRAFQPAKSK